MAKDKERSVNPAQAQRKADKAKALKKARNEQQTRRNEKLARQNPNRIQRQIDDLKALEASGEIKPREKEILANLERDINAIYKAREAQGDRAPHTGNRPTTSTREAGQGGDRSVLGKRGFDGQRKRHHDGPSSGSDTDESVRNIPMPRDTPPPMPRDPRRDRPSRSNQGQQQQQQQQQQHSAPRTLPVIEAKTTYSSAPQLRDLTKEAVSRFVPGAVRRKQDAAKGYGGLLEPEEMDKLEQEGYYRTRDQQQTNQNESASASQTHPPLSDEEAKRLQEEEARFERELAEQMDNDMDVDDRQTAPANQSHSTPTEHHEATPAPIPQVNKEEEQDDDADSSEDDYLPPILTGNAKPPPTKPPLSSLLFSSLPKPQSSSTPAASSGGGGGAGGGGLFSSLPKPQGHGRVSRQVEMEEVEDEDL